MNAQHLHRRLLLVDHIFRIFFLELIIGMLPILLFSTDYTEKLMMWVVPNSSEWELERFNKYFARNFRDHNIHIIFTYTV